MNVDWEFIRECLQKGTMRKLTDYLSVFGSAMVEEHEQLKSKIAELRLALTEPVNLTAERVINLLDENERLRHELDEVKRQFNNQENAAETELQRQLDEAHKFKRALELIKRLHRRIQNGVNGWHDTAEEQLTKEERELLRKIVEES